MARFYVYVDDQVMQDFVQFLKDEGRIDPKVEHSWADVIKTVLEVEELAPTMVHMV